MLLQTFANAKVNKTRITFYGLKSSRGFKMSVVLLKIDFFIYFVKC